MTGDELLYLELEDVVRIHARIFALNDETARRRLRDPGALGSALARPLHHAAYQGADIATQAAILAQVDFRQDRNEEPPHLAGSGCRSLT